MEPLKMKKLYIYLDETYNLQNKNQFYCVGGFVTSDSEHIKLEYKRLLKKPWSFIQESQQRG